MMHSVGATYEFANESRVVADIGVLQPVNQTRREFRREHGDEHFDDET
jgi:hypothetical protein